MKFRLNITLNDNDYFEYNKFWMLRSPYGKKQLIFFRIIIAVLLGLYMIIMRESLLHVIVTAIVIVLFEIFLSPLFAFSLKGQLKGMKKRGKMGYSPSAIMEFYEDTFVEITPDNKIEQKYKVIERISVVDHKILYIHINNVAAYLLPLSCFDSLTQYNDFLDFIKTKCAKIDIY